MLGLKMISIMGLTICLNACGSVKPIQVPQRLFDYENSRCLERQYKYSKEYIGPVGSTKEVPIEYCDKMLGYDPETYLKVLKFMEDVRAKIKKK